MYLSQLILGILVGITASIPLGPVGVLCVQRTLNNDLRTGFVSGLGAATADTIFAIVAMFFLSMVTSLIESHMTIFTIVGGTVLSVVGAQIYSSRKKVIIRRRTKNERSLVKDYGSVLLLTLTNPAFILVFVTLFATFGIKNSGGILSPLITIFGVALGCSIWWFSLTFTVNLLRKRFRPRHLLYLNMTAGIAILLLGASAVVGAIINSLDNI